MNDVELLYRKAVASWKEGDREFSLKILKNLVQRTENNRVHKTYFYLLFSIGQYEEAINYAPFVLRREPEDWRSNMIYAELLRFHNTKVCNERAFFHYKKAADNSMYDNCTQTVAYLYEYGIGVDKDLNSSLYYYRLAAKRGHVGAQYRISSIMFKQGNILRGIISKILCIPKFLLASIRSDAETLDFFE